MSLILACAVTGWEAAGSPEFSFLSRVAHIVCDSFPLELRIQAAQALCVVQLSRYKSSKEASIVSKQITRYHTLYNI